MNLYIIEEFNGKDWGIAKKLTIGELKINFIFKSFLFAERALKLYEEFSLDKHYRISLYKRIELEQKGDLGHEQTK